MLLVSSSAACRTERAQPQGTSDTAPEQASGAEAGAEAGAEVPTPPRSDSTVPKLVVVVVVDQMRADYLERFGPQLEHGFARLREHGRMFTQTFHEHGQTETAPGHATIATGCHPSHHGVIANRWYDLAAGKRVNAVDDLSARDLTSGERGSVSASTLLRSSVGDWMQAKDPSSIVVSISLKDRAAILLGGKQPDAAIWYDDGLGAYTSSSYYAEALPTWVTAYNGRGRAAELYGESGWALSHPAASYGDSRATTDPKVITTFNDYSLTKQFPHVIEGEAKQPRNVIRDMPQGDQMSLELALAAVEAEHMGSDAVPDLLLLSLSAGDYTGHRYGPQSVEIHDYYLRLDAALGEFMAGLDAAIGEDNYVFVLSSDHGVAPMPEYSEFETAGRFVGDVEVPKLLAEAAAAVELPSEQIPTFVYTHGANLVFDPAVDEPMRTRFRTKLAELGRAHPLLANVWTREELLDSDEGEPGAAAFRHSFHPERSPDLIVQLERGVATYPEGTNHGTPYAYDQHVPLIVLGAGAPGVYAQAVSTVDIAPTIAELVGVRMPEGVDGKPLPLGSELAPAPALADE